MVKIVTIRKYIIQRVSDDKYYCSCKNFNWIKNGNRANKYSSRKKAREIIDSFSYDGYFIKPIELRVANRTNINNPS